MMAKRDAWSLAYAVRKQNGTHTSNAYEAKSIILTRSNLFISRASDFLRGDDFAYPPYATIPVMQLRRFSTMFLVTFGGDESESVIRSDLVSGCEDILRASPQLVNKIRSVLTSLEQLTHEEIDAALHDPTIVAEFAMSTGDDVALVSSDNGAALLEIIKNATQKDAELRYEEERKASAALHSVEIGDYAGRIDKQANRIDDLENGIAERDADKVALAASVLAQRDFTASVLARDITRRAQLFWKMILGLVIVISVLLGADVIWKYTGLNSTFGIVGAVVLAICLSYSFLLPFFPRLEPNRARIWFVQRALDAESVINEDADMLSRVRAKLGLPDQFTDTKPNIVQRDP